MEMKVRENIKRLDYRIDWVAAQIGRKRQDLYNLLRLPLDHWFIWEERRIRELGLFDDYHDVFWKRPQERKFEEK